MTLDQWLAERERQEREATPGPWTLDIETNDYGDGEEEHERLTIPEISRCLFDSE